MKHLAYKFAILTFISILTFPFTTSAQLIQIDSTFNTSTEIFPFSQVDSIYNLTITGSVTLNSDTSLVRVILVDDNYNEKLIYEAYPMITSTMTFNFITVCDETCYLNGINPSSIILYIKHASVELQNVAYSTLFVSDADSLNYYSKRHNDSLKVETINNNISARGWEWTAGHTALVLKSYEEKTNIFGENYDLQGYDYYTGGVFKYISRYSTVRSSSNLVESFDWRDRHGSNINEQGNVYYGGSNGWITPFQSQGSCGACAAFGVTAMVEAMTNLYFNTQFVYGVNNEELNLSEFDVWCGCDGICYGSNAGIEPTEALLYIKHHGIVNESCYPYAPPCPDPSTMCTDPTTKIKIDGSFSVDDEPGFDYIKTNLIQYGPLAQWLRFGTSNYYNHEVLLVGYRYNPETNATIWIYKDSNFGYFVELDITSPNDMYQTHAIKQGPYWGIHQLIGDDYVRECRDFDNDGYYNWGVGYRLDGCGDADKPQDSDDYNPRLGPFDGSFFSTPVTPIMKVEENGTFIPDSSFYNFYDSDMVLGDQKTLTFTITNTGNAQLNLIPNTFNTTIELSNYNPDDFTLSYPSNFITQIPMESGTTTFDITFKLNSPINESKAVKVTIHTDEIDMDDYTFNLVFSDCDQTVALEEIQGVTYWNGNNNLKYGNVIVKAGATLNITGDYAFSPNANLYIEQGDVVNGSRLNGGIVNIDGGRITSLCGTWPGIDVWGNRSQTQFYDLENSGQAPLYQGLIRVINGGEINNAIAAIETIKYDANDEPISSSSGGIVYFNGGKITDCKQGVVFYPYKNFYPTINDMQPNWSVFFKAEFYNEHESPINQIRFDGVNGIYIKGSTFENKFPISILPQVSWRGIYSINSGFTVTYLNNPYPNEDTIKSSFTGFNSGIYANAEYITPENFININSSIFNDNERGIYLSAIDNPKIVQNEFLVRKNNSIFDALSQPPEMIGLYLDNYTMGFTIEENSFYSDVGYSGLFDKECSGITVNNSGTNFNELYNNYFDNLTVGIAAGGENRSSEGDGLCIKCNDFSNCLTDIYVAPLKDGNGNPITGSTIGIAKLQGKPGNGDTKNPAGNTFSNLTNPDLYNFEKDVNCEYTKYTHHNKAQTNEIVEPTPYLNIEVAEDANSLYSKNLSCPSNLGTGTDPVVEKSTLSTEIVQINTYIDTLNSEVDGGNTDQLNLDVATSAPNQTIQLRQQLLDESPYLSDTVMKSAIDKENVLPNAVIRDVLTANPQSAKSVEVIQSLDERIVTMPDYMLTEVMQGLNTVGAKEILEQKLSEHRTNYTKALRKIERYYLVDTSNQSVSIDSIVSLWNNQVHLESKYKLAFHYLSVNDSANLFSDLISIPFDFDLSEKQQDIHDLYEDLFEILWQTNNDTTQIDSTHILSLIDISDYYMTPPGTYALNSLINRDIIQYHEPVYFPDYFKSLNVNVNDFNPQSKEYLIKVFPNPAGDYCIIDYDLTLNEGSAIIDIYDSYGHKLSSYGLENIHSQRIISLSDFTSGVYFITLSINSSQKESHKLIISK